MLAVFGAGGPGLPSRNGDLTNARGLGAGCVHAASVAQPIRTAEFERFFTGSVRDIRRLDPERLELVLTGGAEPSARDLAARESSCCSFFTFDFTTSAEGTVMGVGVPAAYIEVLDASAAG